MASSGWVLGTQLQRARESLGLGVAAVSAVTDMLGLLTSLGVRTFAIELPKDQVAGTSWWHPELGPAVMLNRRDGAPRRAFTAAHELAHLLVSESQALCGTEVDAGPDEERLADAFAAAFLMPEEDLRGFARVLLEAELLTGWETTDAALGRVARRSGVSREAAAWRLERLQFVPQRFTAVRRALWRSRPQYFRGRRGSRWRHRLADLGSRHIALASRAFEEQKISFSYLATALQLDPEQAFELMEG